MLDRVVRVDSPSCGPKGVARREFDVVAAWSVCRLGRSLSDLIDLLGELRSRDIDLYLHQQALDTSTPSGRALFGMLSVFSEFERAMIRDRVMAGLDRARSSGKRLGRPRTTPFQVQRIRLALDEGSRCARDGEVAEGVRRQGQRGAAHVGDLGRSASLIGRLQSEPTRSPYYGLNLPSHMADGRRCRILLKSTCHENTYKEVIPSRTIDPSRCSSRNWGCA